MKRRVLGKGMDALLPSVESDGAPLTVDIDLLYPNPKQPRLSFGQDSLDELAASIRENGIVQPIVARRRGDRYEIVAGERRWRAAQTAALTKVPVVVREVPDDKMLELALLENIQREDLNPIEEARAYHLLIQDQKLKQDELARRLGKARPTITNALRLLQLPQGVQDMLEHGQLTAGQARPLLSLPGSKLQVEIARVITERDLSAREAERLVGRLLKTEKGSRVKSPVDPHVLAAEEKLCQRLGTRVRIQTGGRGGQIVIHYGSSAELERLYSVLSRVEA
ncbi:MAG TPA: ParB/RepB/Spo0J family partition protein [Acidobacteriota bacterium]|nr:ParB/RepB/Spo0J family partition protein [Acidobacteriota bacterium]